MTRRQAAAAVAAIAGAIVLACGGFAASIATSMPTSQGARVDGGDLVGIDAGGAYTWIVPTATGVVVVDAGLDDGAFAAVRKEIGARPIVAVLVTHGHMDHIGGIGATAPAPVWCGPGEASMLRGETRPRGWMQTLVFNHLMAPTSIPATLAEAKDGEALDLDGERFLVVHVPGHTPGSAMFVWKDVLFSGDSLLGHGDHVAPTHWAFADDYALNVASLAKLAALPVDRLADGHGGLHTGVRPQLAALAP